MQKDLIFYFKKYWPLILILVAAFGLRLINLKELFYFTYDESVFAFVGRRLILWNHIPLIGGVTPFGVHVAPYFYWFFAVLLYLGNLDPISWGYFSAVLGAITSLSLFYVAYNFFDKKTAFVSSAIWAFSTLAGIYDRHFWGLTFGPIFSLIILFLLKSIIDGKVHYIFPLALTLAIIIHADLSYLVFLFVTVIVWFIYKLPLKKLAFIFFIILLLLMPLLVFDLRHNFSNTRPLLKYLKADKTESRFNDQTAWDRTLIFGSSFSRFLIPTFDNEISKQYSYCESFIKEKYEKVPNFLELLSLLIIALFALWSVKSKKTAPIIMSIMVGVFYIGIQSYGFIVNGDVFEHYLTGLFPVYIIIFAFFITRLPKILWVSLLAVLLIFNMNKTLNLKNSHGLKNKQLAIEYVNKQVGNSDFSLDSVSTCWKYSGYRYLFAVYGREPVKSYVDPNFGYLYGDTKISSSHPDIVAAIITHDFVPEKYEFYERYSLLKSHETSSKLFGNIEVIIMDNKNKWF